MNENERIYLGRTKAGKGEGGEGGGERATRTGFSYRGFRFKHGAAEAQKEERFIQFSNLRLVAAVLKISTSVHKPRPRLSLWRGMLQDKRPPPYSLDPSIRPKVFIFRGPRISPAQIHTSTCGFSFAPSSAHGNTYTYVSVVLLPPPWQNGLCSH